jgi:hypothetical protein
MPRQEWGGIEPMGEVFLLTFLFIGLVREGYRDKWLALRLSVSELAIYHQLRRGFVSVNNAWAASVRRGRFSSTCRLREPKASPLSATNVCGAHPHRALHPRNEAFAGCLVSTLSRAQDGSRILKSCVRLWKTPIHEGSDPRTAVLLDQEERVPTRSGESR